MRRILAILGFLTGVFLLCLAAAIFAFYHLMQVGELRRFLVSEFESRSGLKLEIGAAEVEIGSVLGVSFKDLALSDPKQNITIISAPRVFIRVALLPLMRRKVVFYGVRLEEPKATIVRDAEGRVPWLDAILNLPFRRQDAEFSLDLRDVRIGRGELHFSDLLGETKAIDTRYGSIELTLRRMRGAGLRSALQSLKANAVPLRSGLDFDVKTIVYRGEQHADVAVNGRALFSDDAFDLRKARVDAYLTSASSPAALLWEYSGRGMTNQAPQGDLAYRVRWQGSMDEGGRITAEVRFKGAKVDARELFRAAVELGDGSIDVAVDWKPEELHFERLALRSTRLAFAGRGSITALNSGDPRVAFRLSTPFLPLTVMRDYIPANVLQSPRLEYVAAGLTRGDIRFANAEITGKLSELRRLTYPGQEGRISFHADVRDAGGEYGGDRPIAVAGVGGGIALEQGVIQYRNIHGNIGQSRLADLSGTHRRAFSGAGPLDLRIRGDVELGEIREHLPAEILPVSAANAIAAVHDVAGRARVDAALRADFVSPAYYEGIAALEGVHFRAGNVALAQVRGDLRFSPAEISVERAHGTLNGSDVNFGVLLKDFARPEGTFDVAIDSPGVNASDALALLLPLDFSKSPGIVRGAVRYRGVFASPDDRRLTGQLEIVGARIPLPVFDEPFREVSGRIRINGKTIDLEGMRARVAGYAFSLDGRWTGGEKPMLGFTLSSPDLDLRYILPHHAIPDEEWYERLQVRGSLSLGKGSYDKVAFTEMKTDVLLEKRIWRLEHFFARAQGGTVEGSGEFNDRDEIGGFIVEPDIKEVPLPAVLGWFDADSSEVTGTVRLTGKIAFSGKTPEERKRNLNGALRIRVENGMMRRFQLAVRVLSFLDLSRWFTLKLPNINQEGIRFRSVSADIKIAEGIYRTQDFFLDGEDLRITGAGELDGAKRDVDFIIAVRPFPGLDQAWNYVPVLGTGLAAIKNSLLVASFHVHGPIKDPTVTPAPLSTLSEFFYGALAIPKGLIGIPSMGAPKEPTASK